LADVLLCAIHILKRFTFTLTVVCVCLFILSDTLCTRYCYA